MSCDTGQCGVGGWGGPQPGDPGNNSILSANPAFGGIDVTWNLPTTNPHAVAYTKLYRGLLADFDTAILIREVGGTFYYDALDDSNRYYYWIQIVSVNGTVGELIGPASAVANPLIAGMIEQLTGEIDDGMLATTLRGQLDQISILNDQLLQETFDRETGQTSLAQAIADAAAGVAEAHTFLLDEVNSRTSENAAIVEQINGVAASLGADIAEVNENMTASIDALTGTVYAMWTVQVNVNGLVGGFGMINDGLSVEAGFDVDRFWVGRTSEDMRKPFIIDDGVVYIDEGAINSLTFSKLRDESGSFIVEDGKIKADYLTVQQILGGYYIDSEWPGYGGGFYLGPAGFKMGDHAAGHYFQVTPNGDIYASSFSMVGGVLAFTGEVISTDNLSDESVNIFKLARGASLPDYVRTYKGWVTPTVPLDAWMALQLDSVALTNKLGATDYDEYRTLLPAGTYFYELSVPVKSTGSDTNDAAYTCILKNPPGTTTFTDSDVLSTAGVTVVGDWQTATVFGVGRFSLSAPTYVSAAVKTTDSGPTLNVVARPGYSTTILRIWRDET